MIMKAGLVEKEDMRRSNRSLQDHNCKEVYCSGRDSLNNKERYKLFKKRKGTLRQTLFSARVIDSRVIMACMTAQSQRTPSGLLRGSYGNGLFQAN